MLIRTALIICCTLIMSCSSFAESNSVNNKVSIIDSRDNRQRLISDTKQLNRFRYFWSQKQPIKQQQSYDWRYQIIIEEAGSTSRWVYDPKGYAGEITLSKSKSIYQLIPVRSFNRYLKEE